MSKLVVTESFEQILAGCRAAAEKFLSRSEEQKYDRLEGGLWLLKARDKWAATAHNRKREGGFEQWCASNFPDVPMARIYESINLAQNLNLTAASTVADVDALRESKALAGRPLKPLFKAPEQKALSAREEAPEPEAPHDPVAEAQQLLLPLFENLRTFALHEDDLYHLPLTAEDASIPSLESCERSLRLALDKVSRVKTEKLKSAA